MIYIKHTLTFGFLALCYIFYLSDALTCKVCVDDDPSCLFSENTLTRQCENDTDECFTWLHRAGGQLTARRNCISTDSSEYISIKRLINNRNSGCFKRISKIDCFTFCSSDLCN